MSIISGNREIERKMEKTLRVYLSQLILFFSKLWFWMFVGFVENKVLWQDAPDFIHINQRGTNMFPGSTLENKTSFFSPSILLTFCENPFFLILSQLIHFPNEWLLKRPRFIGHISFCLSHFNHIWYFNVTRLKNHTIFWPKGSRKSVVNQKSKII